MPDTIDIPAWSAPVSPEKPGGPDIAEVVVRVGGDDFMAPDVLGDIKRSIRNWPPPGVFGRTQNGDPDWQSIADKCADLFAQVRHIQACTYLTVAHTELRGLPGAAEGLKLLANLVADLWPHVQPGPPEVEKSMIQRRNWIAELSRKYGKDGDIILFRDRLARVLLFPSKPALTLEALLQSEGKFNVTTSEGQTEDAARAEIKSAIEAARRALPPEDLHAVQAMVQDCQQSLSRIVAALAQGPQGDDPDPPLSHLQESFSDIARLLGGGSASEHTTAATAGGSSNNQSGGGSSSFTSWRDAQINRDEDATLVLEAVRRYIEQRDRASPLPLVLEFAKRLIGLGYEDVQKGLPPDRYNSIKEGLLALTGSSTAHETAKQSV